MNPAMDPAMKDETSCTGCAGIEAQTPMARSQPAGLPGVAYRIGTQPQFAASLRARLASSDFPVLAGLSSREPSDWTLALTDAFAGVCDVLSFYQERIANESFLRTATERRSLIELAALIGYQPAPGVAASTALAFTLDSAPGQPAASAQPVTIPIGTRVQSVPDSGQQPQTFETIEAVDARVEWNALPVARSAAPDIRSGTREVWIAGIANTVQAGDAILIVGSERSEQPASDSNSSERWDVRVLQDVMADAALGLSRLRWAEPLGSVWPASAPTSQGIEVHVFRQRAALFGYNAPNAALFMNANKESVIEDADAASLDYGQRQIYLDAAYPKLLAGSWIALTGGEGGTQPLGYVELYRVQAASIAPYSRYGISAKVTSLTIDIPENTEKYAIRTTQVLAQSEPLTLAATPLDYPLYGNTLELEVRSPVLAPGRSLAISGRRQWLQLPADTAQLSASKALLPHARYALMGAIEQQQEDGSWLPVDCAQLPIAASSKPLPRWRWPVLDYDGSTLSIEGPADQLQFIASPSDDAVVTEIVRVASGAAAVSNEARTRLQLAAPMRNCYERASTTVNANVANATHGETVSEIAGSGDGSTINQRFVLKQLPQTYVASDSPDGADATLHVRVNDLLWSERASLYGAAPQDRVYTLKQNDDGHSIVSFGDGRNGARLPTGSNNVRFNYRKGIGAAGNVRAGQISTLLSRPLGVRAALNPEAASGGTDAESADDLRANAPIHVLTLDRAVSTQDYADFARAYAGIGKAHALWIASGPARGVHLSIAGPDGAAIPDNASTRLNLIAALRRYGDPLLPLDVRGYARIGFGLKAAVRVAADAQADVVLDAIRSALCTAYAFQRRAFGQPVTQDEVYAVIQNVAGVVAVNLQALYAIDTGRYGPQPQSPLLAALPAVQADGSVCVAELLQLDDAHVELGVQP